MKTENATGWGAAPATALPLPEIVYQQLRKAIMDGVFAPGQVLRQVEVATQLGVSRSPLREALPRLESEGMVVSHPRRGYAVAVLDPEEVTEAFELRRLLEVELAARSIVKRDASDVARVYEILAAMEVKSGRRETAFDSGWFELNTQFHHALLAPARWPHHLRALENSCVLLESHIRAEVRMTGDVVQAQAEHEQLAQAFAAGEPSVFVGLIRRHAQHTRDRLLSGIGRP